MATEPFDERLDQLERGLRIINTIEGNPELQAAAFAHLFGDRAPASKLPRADAATKQPEGAESGSDHDGSTKPRSASKRTSKGSPVTMDKNLETAPKGAKSWKEFIAEKKPVTHDDRNVCAVFWLSNIAGHDKVNASLVFTLYVDAGWKPPADPKNALQKTASTVALVDTANMEDIRVTPRGVGRVNNDLPLLVTN